MSSPTPAAASSQDSNVAPTSQASGTITVPSGVPSVLGPEKLKLLYSTMLKLRLVEEESRPRKKGTRPKANCHYEAMLVGTLINLRPEDLIAVASNADNVRDESQVFRQVFAPETTLNIPLPDNTSIGGLWTSLAAGVAQAMKAQGKKSVLVAIALEDRISSNSLEAVSFASAQKLPVVFLTAQSARPPKNSLRKTDKPLAPQIAVDGNDVVAVFRVAYEAIRRAREGHGPTLISCWFEAPATGSTLRGRQRPSKRGPEDPLEHMEQYLRQRSLWSDIWKSELLAKIRPASPLPGS